MHFLLVLCQETRPISDVIHTADEQIKLFREPLCLCFLGFHGQCLLLIMRVLRTRQWRQHGSYRLETHWVRLSGDPLTIPG